MEEAQAKTNDIRDTIKAEILVREVEGLTAGTYIIHWASVLSNHYCFWKRPQPLELCLHGTFEHGGN